MQSTPSLPSLSGPLWPGVVAPERVLSMGQIELACDMIWWLSCRVSVLQSVVAVSISSGGDYGINC